MKNLLNRLCTDQDGNKVIPFQRMDDGRYYCVVIEPNIKLIPIVQNSDHVFRNEEDLSPE